MATETETITAISSVSIAECEDSPNPSSQASPTTRQRGKRKNHRGGKRNKKKPANTTKPQAVSGLLVEITGIAWEKITEQQTPKHDEKKRRVEEAKVQPEPTTENVETVIAHDDVNAIIAVQSKVLARLAMLEALEVGDKFRAGCEEAENNAANNSLVSHSENYATKAAGQEVQIVPKKVAVTYEDTGILNDLEQEHEHTQDHFSDSPDQRHTDTGKKGAGSRAPDYIGVISGQDFEIKETVVTAGTKKEDRDGVSSVKQGIDVANEDNNQLEKKDNLGSDAANRKERDNVANDAAAVLEDILNTSKQENICITTNETTIYAPQDTTTTASPQDFAKTEAEDADAATAEEAEDSGSIIRPYNDAVSEHFPALAAEKEINGIPESPCLVPKEAEVKENKNGAVTATVTSAEVAVSPKLDLAPPTEIYEIKPVTNKGIGMFATHFIPRGTRILREPPLLLLEKGHGEEIYHVPLKFQQLSPTDQASYLTLAATPNADRDPGRLEWLQILSETPIHANLDLPMADRQRVLQIFETNSFAADAGSAIVYDASRMNHSCTPNVYHNWNATLGEQGELTVHAIRDIEAGEEIQTSYINICAYQSKRQEQLNRYGFQCDCKACDTQTQFGRDSEARRQRLCVVNRRLVERYLYPDRGDLYYGDDEEATLDAVVEIIKLLQAEGLVHMELTRHYRLAYTITAMLGAFPQACIWAEKAMQQTEICTGTDYASYAQDEENLRILKDRVRTDTAMAVGR